MTKDKDFETDMRFFFTFCFLVLLFIGISGREFPLTFQQTVRGIFKQLIRVFAHIYHSHYDKVLSLCQEGHFNSLFAHFVSFGREFDLLDKKDIVPLQDLIDIMDGNGILC